MSRVPGDFDEFVTARWRELYAVATVTTGDPGSAAGATASALAALGRRWDETTASGAPTAAARTAVLRSALGSAQTSERTSALAAPEPSGTGTPGSGRPGAHGDLGERDGDGTPAALTAALAEAPATARAALASHHWWDTGPNLVAAAARTDVATVQGALDALERRLAEAHAAALGRDEREVGWSLADAVSDALDHAADAAPVADPAGLVAAERARGTRRRTRGALVAAAVAVAVSAATVVAWPGPGTVAPPAPDGPTRDDPAWAAVSSWGQRGSLVQDPAVVSIAAGARDADPAARVLYAGPVGDTLTLVMTGTNPGNPTLPAGIPGPALGEGFDGQRAFLRLWTAPARLGTGALALTTIDGEPTARADDLVALSVDQGSPGDPPAVLVMTRPTVADGFVTTGALPLPDGSVAPVVVDLPLVDGVATFAPAAHGFPLRVDVSGYSGPPAGPVTGGLLLPQTGPAPELAAAQRTLLAGVTGHAPDSLETTSVLESEVPASAIDPDYIGTYPDFVGPHPHLLRVTVVTTFTPEGGRVRTSRLSGGTAGAPWTYLERLAAVPSTDPHALLLLPSGRHPAFVAIAPDGATVELVTREGRLRGSATVHQGVATLASAQDSPGTVFRLRVRAPDGHVVYDAVPPEPVELVGDDGGRD